MLDEILLDDISARVLLSDADEGFSLRGGSLDEGEVDPEELGPDAEEGDDELVDPLTEEKGLPEDEI